jgi:hypothetical protein
MEITAGVAGIAPAELPPATAAWIDAVLEDREVVRWIGQPCAETARWRGWWQVPLGVGALGVVGCIVWPLMSGFLAVQAESDHLSVWNQVGQGLVALVMLIPMAALYEWGLKALRAPWWMPAQSRATAYVVTDRRALVFLPDARGRLSSRQEYRVDHLVATPYTVRNAFPSGVHVVLRETWLTDPDTGARTSVPHGFLHLAERDARSAGQALAALQDTTR